MTSQGTLDKSPSAMLWHRLIRARCKLQFQSILIKEVPRCEHRKIEFPGPCV